MERIIATPQWEEVMMLVQKIFVYDIEFDVWNCMDKGIGKTECNQITQDNSEKAVDVAADSGYKFCFTCI